MNFLLIDIGCLRADHLSCYGYSRPTSPTIDKLSSEGLLCERAFSSNTTNAGARAAIFSGRFGIETGIETDGLPSDFIYNHTPISQCGLAAQRPMLPELLAANGYKTAAVSPFGRQNARWFYSGWQEVFDTHPTDSPIDVEAEKINKTAIDWLSQNSRNDFFLYLSYNNLYKITDSPLSENELKYFDLLASHGEPKFPDDSAFERHHDLHAAFSPRFHKSSSRKAMRQLIHKYNAKIRALDNCVSQIISTLENLKIFDDTAVIITSDHGILLGECGCYGGHISAHYNCARVPLIIRAPEKIAAGKKFAGLCYALDLSATILNFAGIEIPTGYHSLSIPDLMENSPAGRSFVVCDHGQFTAQRAIISSDWKLNRTWHNGFWNFRDTELYNVKEAPAERKDLAKIESQCVLDLMKKIRDWTNEFCSDKADPLAVIACSEPPGFLSYGQQIRDRVIRGEISPPENYNGRWK